MWDTRAAVETIVQYNKLENGRWGADLERPFKIHVEGETIAECQRRFMITVDKHLAAWMKESANPAAGDTREAGKK